MVTTESPITRAELREELASFKADEESPRPPCIDHQRGGLLLKIGLGVFLTPGSVFNNIWPIGMRN